jgi:ATP-dependent DNA helicase RecQ
MKVLIVAKTRRGKGACIGGITFQGESVRLIAANAATDEQAGMAYHVGDVWEVEAEPEAHPIPPHVENVTVFGKRRCPPHPDPVALIRRYMPPRRGGPEVLYGGLLQATASGALYVAQATGVPACSTLFWIPDQTLTLDTGGKRIRYRYPTPDGGRTLTFVGFQEPLPEIPAGTLLRVSLAHWWHPDEHPEDEPRCFAQLSGWFDLPAAGTAQPAAAPEAPGLNQARRVLKRVFGYDSFLPLQEEIVDSLLAGRNALVVMPTGGGKSLCYQLPALLQDGLTVVVSPLISLMQDQVDQLRENGVAACFLNSSLDYPSHLRIANQVRQGEVKLLYVAPETLLRPETLVLLDDCQVNCLAIDEAHCISAWGHDFRPVYRQLAAVRRRYPQAACIALTATATARVREDIRKNLDLARAEVFVASFNRANLRLAAQARTGGIDQVADFLDRHPDQSGIVYCSTRRQVDTLAARLAALGRSVLPYHAGLDAATRRQNQRRWLHDDALIMVATVAFGMGIDKSNVRFVLHYNLPQSIEGYYQEIGRAGRDGLPADCLLLYNQADIHTQYRLIEQGAEAEQPGRSARLQAMVRYAESRECRRRLLLGYFGEDLVEPCDNCDICQLGEDGRALVDVTVQAQKYFSCVRRTGEQFGMNHIIQVLRGSKAQKVLARGHDRLSTYGIGMEHSGQEWRQLAQQFIAQGLLDQDMDYGGLRLTEAAWAVMRGQQPVTAVLDDDPAMQADGDRERDDCDRQLFEQLRALRRRLAEAAALPPYVIFSDRSLVEMAAFFPQTEEQFLAINGVGERKLAQYGPPFLAEIRQYCGQHGIQARPVVRATRSAPRVDTGQGGRSAEVGELFAAGHSVEQLQELYGVRCATILKHLYNFHAGGGALDPERILSLSGLPAGRRDQVLALFDELGAARLTPVFEALNGVVAYEELHILRLYYRCRKS